MACRLSNTSLIGEASIITARVDMQFDASTGHERQPLRDVAAISGLPQQT